jgi:hypothetical protein
VLVDTGRLFGFRKPIKVIFGTVKTKDILKGLEQR